MGYYDDPRNVAQYIEMAVGYDGRALIEVLKQHLPAGATVLELGMGPGKDLAILGETFIATGSDVSQVFPDRYLAGHHGADVFVLDAVALDTARTFEGIYSNKVLIHLGPAALAASFRRQAAVLAPGGVALHSFWVGEGVETYHGLRSVYHTEKTLRAAVGDSLEIVDVMRYAETEAGDSLYLVVRRVARLARADAE